MRNSIMLLLMAALISTSAIGGDTIYVKGSPPIIMNGVKVDTVGLVVPDSAKLTLNKVYSDAKAGLQGLGSALKVGAEHVYGVMVKQQVVFAVTWLFLLLLSFTGLCNVMYAYKKEPEDSWGDDDSPTFLGVMRAVEFILSVIIFIVCMVHIDNIVMGFINPEYGAIKDILEFVKGK